MRFAVLLGPPGSGKGTVSAIVEKQTSFVHVSTGARIRKEMLTPGSAIGEASKFYMDRSEFVPDDIAMGLIDQILEEFELGGELLFDGFPRTRVQGELFDRIVEERGDQLVGAFSLEATADVLAERLSGRRCCEACGAVFNLNDKRPAGYENCDYCGGLLSQRVDDLKENVEKRIALHNEQTLGLIEYYEDSKLLHRIDAEQAPEISARRIVNLLNTN